jgi:hypothetical protein
MGAAAARMGAAKRRGRLLTATLGAAGALLGDAVAFASAAVQPRRGGTGPRTYTVVPLVVRPPEQPNEATYPLQPTHDGGFVYQCPRFSAVIAPDGHVTFTDAAGGEAVCVGGGPVEAGRCGEVPRPTLFGSLTALLRGGPALPLSPPPPLLFVPAPTTPLAPTLVWVGGTLDRMDAVHLPPSNRTHRYEKVKFLSATFEFRVEMAADWHRRLLREALAELPLRLDALWEAPEYAPAEKRMMICRLWGEVDFADEKARAAADIIETWIRRRLPAGTTNAYRGRELHDCQRQLGVVPGRRRFDPYAAPETEGAVPLPPL